MTRLEKDATKRLIIIGAALAAVAILYFITHNLWVSTSGLAITGILGFMERSRNLSNKEPHLEGKELDQPKKAILFVVIAMISLLSFVQWQLFHLFYNDEIFVRIIAAMPTVWIIILLIFLVWKQKKYFIKKTAFIPKYDEREQKVLKSSMLTAFRVFWVVFVLFNITAGMVMRNKQIPGKLLCVQVFVAMWVYLCALNISIFWQERRIGKEKADNYNLLT